MSVALHHGDCRSVLSTLPAESVQCCVTSPPYFGLRDYGTARWEGGDPACEHGVNRWDGPKQTQGAMSGHASAADRLARSECRCGAVRVDSQIGLEQSPQEYVDQLVAVFREVRRVLRSDGTLWLNLGDSYANDGKWGGSSGGKHVTALHGSSGVGRGKRSTGLKPKDLLLIPARVALALQADGWWVRSEIIWSKAAPMPESVRDRPTCAHEKVWLLTRSARYFYDADAVAEPAVSDHDSGNGYGRPEQVSKGGRGQKQGWTRDANPTRNLRNVWHLNPEPFSGAHFATMPPTLAERCIKAGTSEKGCCPTCGAPWVRMVERTPATVRAPASEYGNGAGRNDGGRSQLVGAGSLTLGWSPSCSCPPHEPVPQTVLDPFAGAGTTLMVASRLQRNAIGVELNAEYCEIIRNRLFADSPLFAQTADLSPTHASYDTTDIGQSDWLRDLPALETRTLERVSCDE